jgi:hypothetical protein
MGFRRSFGSWLVSWLAAGLAMAAIVKPQRVP